MHSKYTDDSVVIEYSYEENAMIINPLVSSNEGCDLFVKNENAEGYKVNGYHIPQRMAFIANKTIRYSLVDTNCDSLITWVTTGHPKWITYTTSSAICAYGPLDFYYSQEGDIDTRELQKINEEYVTLQPSTFLSRKRKECDACELHASH